MKNIDFLPDVYRQREALRQARVWWGIVVLVFGLAIGSSAGAQSWLRHRLERQLQDLGPQYASAQSQVRELSALQSQITMLGHEASLFTYLEHPWPRTQLLAHIVRPLHPSIRLTQIQVIEQELAQQSTQQAGPRRRGPVEDDSAPKPLPPEQDLLRLQAEMDRRQTVIEVDGHTIEVTRLHEYVAEINRLPLVAMAQIKSLEASPATDKEPARTQFTLRVVIHLGHGQGDATSGAHGRAAIAVANPARLPDLAFRRTSAGGRP